MNNLKGINVYAVMREVGKFSERKKFNTLSEFAKVAFKKEWKNAIAGGFDSQLAFLRKLSAIFCQIRRMDPGSLVSGAGIGLIIHPTLQDIRRAAYTTVKYTSKRLSEANIWSNYINKRARGVNRTYSSVVLDKSNILINAQRDLIGELNENLLKAERRELQVSRRASKGI